MHGANEFCFSYHPALQICTHVNARDIGQHLVGKIDPSITARPEFSNLELGFCELGIKYTFLSKKELFFFPMNLVMKKFGSIAVRGVKGKNAIYQVVDILNQTDELNVVISPEGRISKVNDWNKGFYYMAVKANVPVVVGYLDYEKKQMGIKGSIYDLSNYDKVIAQINEMYKDVKGKNPEDFVLARAS